VTGSFQADAVRLKDLPGTYAGESKAFPGEVTSDLSDQQLSAWPKGALKDLLGTYVGESEAFPDDMTSNSIQMITQ